MNECQVIWLHLQDFEKEASRRPIFVNNLHKLNMEYHFQENHQKTKTNVGICEAVWWTGWNSSLIPLSNLQLFQQMASHYFQAVYFCPISFDIYFLLLWFNFHPALCRILNCLRTLLFIISKTYMPIFLSFIIYFVL